MDRSGTLGAMSRAALVAVVRTATPEQALEVGKAVAQGGIGCVEITLTVPGAAEVIRELRRDLTGTLVGAGTVMTLAQAEAVLVAGARFLVSPTQELPLVRLSHEAEAVCVLGSLTPTEIWASARGGADMVKVFPIACVGGPLYIKELLAPLPNLSLMVSGGVTFDTFLDYLELGVSTVAIGGDLMPRDLVEAGKYQAITERARRYVAALEGRRKRKSPIKE